MDKTDYEKSVDFSKIPRHIAIIMDGNGRWANRKFMPRTMGHKAGMEALHRTVETCARIKVAFLSVYAFSTENWKRPEGEVDAIMGLIDRYLKEAISVMEHDRNRLRIFGDTSVLSEELQTLIGETNEISTHYEGFQANLCINYGGRDEILRAAEMYANDVITGKAEGDLTEEKFSGYMYSAGMPDPDLVIRPGGELRISNFLLWQSAYAEFYFTDVLWPDFSSKELDKAIIAYQSRDRRYGGVKDNG